MRPIVAVLLLAFLVFPRMASAKKKPLKIIPALANAKVIGVQCNSSNAPISPQACRQVVASLQSLLGGYFKVVKTEVVADPLGFSARTGAGQPDVTIEAWDAATKVHGALIDRWDTIHDFGFEIKDARTGKRICFNNTVSSVKDIVDTAYEYVFLHSGLAAQKCATLPEEAALPSRPGRTVRKYSKAWWRLEKEKIDAEQTPGGEAEEFCKENGLWHEH